ncbi:hypothetical protein AB0G35_29805 [Streptomyces sp. NPDC021749]|uniref:WXG100-like domain-containing protein n=1 Tax=Streptomyces sp. NPDC021749 TaxID=3154905 RepID=UPI0033C333CD
MGAADKAKEIVQDLTGMWWPEGDEDELREAARAWRTFADDVEDCTAACHKKAQDVIDNNKGKSIEAFGEFWRKYHGGGKGYLDDVATAARDMAKALDKYADQVAEAKKKIEHELEIAGAVLVAGTALAVFTGGISEVAAAGATEAIVAAASSAGIAVSATVAEITGTVLATAAIGGIEAITVDVVVAQGGRNLLGDQHGINLAEIKDAGVSGVLLGGAFGAAGRGAKAIADASGAKNVLGKMELDGLGGPRLPMAGEGPVGPTGRPLMRNGEGGGGASREAGQPSPGDAPRDHTAHYPVGRRGKQEETSIRSPDADDKAVNRGNREVKVALPDGKTAKNAPATIHGRPYTGHALDRMQQRGFMPSVVEDTIRNGEAVPGKIPNTTAHYNHAEGMTVITNTETGRVVTVSGGIIKQ